jgi:hypothetical protein
MIECQSKTKKKARRALVIGGVAILACGIGGAVFAQAIINNFDYGTLKIAQNLPSGKWKQVTRSGVYNVPDSEEIGCVSGDDIRQGLRGMAMNALASSGSSPGSCPVRVDLDTPNAAQVTSVCPSSITLIPVNVPVTFKKIGASQAYVVESCETTPQGTKFVRSEFTWLGQCDGSAPSRRAIPRLTTPYRCGEAPVAAAPATPRPPKARAKKK